MGSRDPQGIQAEPGGNQVLSDSLAARMLEASADTVLLIRPSGHIAVVSSTADRKLGRPLAYWEGRHINELVHPEDAGPFRRMLDGDPSDPYAIRRDVLRVRVLSVTTGEWILLECRGFTRIDHESVTGSVVSFRDAAGLLGLSESRGLAAATIVENGASTRSMDNRHLAATQILPSVLRSCASAKHLCVLGLRMTNYDEVAAAHGRRVADRVVVHSADAVTTVIRPSDLVVRITDRRLAITCANLEPSAVSDVAARVRAVCKSVRLAGGATLNASMGFALSSGNDDMRQVLDFALDANQLDPPTVKAGHRPVPVPQPEPRE